MTNSAIEVRNLSKEFHLVGDQRNTLKERMVRGASRRRTGFWALRDVDLDVPHGSFFGLIGHNGSGKSTLLKILARIYRPTSGTVAVDGRVSALLELGAGFHPDLSGWENIRLNGAILGLRRREVDAIADEIVAFSGLGDFINEPVKTYSSGMYVRLGFSVAVHMKPDVLLVDEVIAVGDEDFQRRCFDHLFKLRREGVTLVLVSHALGIVQSLCDRVAWLDHGRLMAVGPAPDVVGQYLDSVNAAEAESGFGAASGPIEEGRRGSGEVRVTAIRAVDPAGERLAFVTEGAPIRLRIDLDSRRTIEPSRLRVDLTNESGLLISSFGSDPDALPLSVPLGKRQVDVVLPFGSLNQGHYHLRTTVTDASRSHLYDELQEAGSLVVRVGPGQERPGLVSLRAQFEPVDTP